MLHDLIDDNDDYYVPLAFGSFPSCLTCLFVVDAWKLIEHKAYDHKVDVFSFGVLLWELLTRKVVSHLFLWEQRKYSSLQIIVLLSLHLYNLMVAQKSYESSVFSD